MSGYYGIPKSCPEVPRPKTGVTQWPGVMSLSISHVKYSAGARAAGSLAGAGRSTGSSAL